MLEFSCFKNNSFILGALLLNVKSSISNLFVIKKLGCNIAELNIGRLKTAFWNKILYS